MADYDFRTQRLFLEADLAAGVALEATREQAGYLLSVLRIKAGDPVLLFNGRDGEWLARVEPRGRKSCKLHVVEQTRPQPPPYRLVYCFAPLKKARLDYLIQKAVEMGVGILQPVTTEHTQVTRLNLERMAANAREAAEQCGILSLPEIRKPAGLESLLAGWPADMPLIFCDEAADAADNVAVLNPLKGRPLAVIVGPEGGFSLRERERLLAAGYVVRISLGPRILRADTAAVAALAAIQMVAGDWSGR